MRPSPVSTSSLPAPPFATGGTFNGGFETRINFAVVDIYDSLEGRYSRLSVAEGGDVFLLDDETTWRQVEAFYDSTFGQPPLNGFVRQPAVPLKPSLYQMAVWSRGDEVLGVAMVPGQPGDPLPFLLRFGTASE